MDSLDVLKQNLEVACGFEPYASEEMQALRIRCHGLGADGHFELYKTTKSFSSACGAGAPASEGRQQHHFPPASELPF
jgi:hypothetical protein